MEVGWVKRLASATLFPGVFTENLLTVRILWYCLLFDNIMYIAFYRRGKKKKKKPLSLYFNSYSHLFV